MMVAIALLLLFIAAPAGALVGAILGMLVIKLIDAGMRHTRHFREARR
jgi:NhaP-type Na+/H+ or K+/H+ antiporter